ncbi:hypothetical protein [Moraxella sp.]|uniref:hypothetical protein n=1 Tax=Moraxella sp. TaxID=479 RepID=UPI0026DB86D0|nr:hypothetical protein [Moraxella sp.]MDO4895522.1 hypothetical protein [Moraxella sp.]
MKILKTLLACSLIAFAGQSFANTTPIKFAKGSYCGSFTGNYANRTFTLGLGKGQTLLINGNEGAGVDGAKDIIVKGPNGKTLPYDGQDYGQWIVRTTGKHTIKIIPYSPRDAYSSIEFCAY